MRGLTSRSPLALADFTVLLDWPDVSQPLRYLTGFPAVGHIEHTGIFRDILDTQEVEEQDFLGQDAIDFVDSLITKPPSPDAATIWSLTVEESTKGWCSGPFSRAQMDVTFQRGGWRPVPRFLVTQLCGKQRLIDDAKKGSHNLATSMTETIYTIGIDLIRVPVDGLARSVSHEVPDHATINGGTLLQLPSPCSIEHGVFGSTLASCTDCPRQSCHSIACPPFWWLQRVDFWVCA